MTILVNTQTEQEEKVLLAFLDSLDIQYKTSVEGENQIFSEFIETYNQDLEKANAEIESGNSISQKEVEHLFSTRRQLI